MVSGMRTEIPMTEGVLLVRQNGTTVAIHLTSVEVILEAVVVDHPNIELGYATHYGGSSLDHYAVEANGSADRITMWVGPDPFDRPELDSPREAVEA
jgi:hypothetical protein